MYTLYRSPGGFYECIITVVIALLCTTAAPPPKKKKKIFRVNLLSEVAWMSRNSLHKPGLIYEDKVAATGLEPTTT